MIIEKTKILDVNNNPDELNKCKIEFTDCLLNAIFPLLDDYHTKKKNELNKIKSILTEKNTEVQDKKTKLETLVLMHKRLKRINTIIEEIEKMFLNDNALYLKPTFKREIINILQSLTRMDDSGLKYYLKYISNIRDRVK